MLQTRRLPTSGAAVLAAVAASVLVGVTAGSGTVTPRFIQVLVGLALLAFFVYADRDARSVPIILRPGAAMTGALLVASASLQYLTPSEYESAYLPLWALQALGFVAAYLLFPHVSQFGRRNTSARGIDAALLSRYSLVAFLVCAAAAAWYFKTVGIGALSGDLEQSRVDAAEGSSGYLRLIAFLLPAPTILLVACNGWRKSWWAILASAVFILGVGSRVPMLYFVLPLVVMAAVSGRKFSTAGMLAIGIAAIAFLGWYGAFRIEGTENLRRLPMYKNAVAAGDTSTVALLSMRHYAAIVPANAVLTKRLVDEERIPMQWGRTYVTLFTSVLPGKQTSPDMLIRQASGKEYIGGGTPPTLGGEGYMNFGYLGVFASAAAFMLLLRFWEATANAAAAGGDRRIARVDSAIYGYVLVWGIFANVSGIAGSATITLASFLTLIGLRTVSRI